MSVCNNDVSLGILAIHMLVDSYIFKFKLFHSLFAQYCSKHSNLRTKDWLWRCYGNNVRLMKLNVG